MSPDEAPHNSEWSKFLTPREREVALLVGRGLANKEIARELRLSNGTVKLHIHSIFLKLGARRRHMLVRMMTDRSEAMEEAMEENVVWS